MARLILFLLALVSSCRAFSTWGMHSSRRLRPSQLPLRAATEMPPKTKMSYAVGDVVVAEVDDIVGTVDDPVIALKIRDGDNEARAASMNTRDLSPMERLAFQTGSVVQVKIANMEKETIQVTLARQAIQKQENWQSKSKGKGKSRGDDAVASGEDGSRSRQESKRPRGAYKIKAKAAPQPPPPANLLLNNLKAGAEIEGVVTSLSNYAAFVQTNIMRKSKGGGYSPVTAMLHDSDLAGRVKLASQVKEYSEKPVLEVGAEVTAFVKEVYKNAGRFTLTLDEHIDKSKVVEEHKRTKEEALARRRSRRIRRLLDTVYVGDTVDGVVQEIIPEGVLIALTSLGPLNITGMIGKRDLPKQFQIPGDLQDSFQEQLLSQDFVPGRAVTCSVNKVNQKWNPRMKYNLKLELEGLGPELMDELSLDDDVEITSETLAAFERAKASEVKIEDDDDDDEVSGLADGDFELETEDDFDYGDEEDDADESDAEEEDIFWEADVKEIYEELCEGNKMLSVANLRAWADLQDMVDESDIKEADIDRGLKEVLGAAASGKARLSLEQFSDFVDFIQDVIDGEAPAPADMKIHMNVDELLNDDEEEDDGLDDDYDEDDFAVDDADHEVEVSTSGATAETSFGSQKDAALDDIAKMAEMAVPEMGRRTQEDAEEDMRREARELFKRLKGKGMRNTVKISAFKDSEEIQTLLGDDIIDMPTLNILIEETGQKQELGEDQLVHVMMMLNEYIGIKFEEDLASGEIDSALLESMEQKMAEDGMKMSAEVAGDEDEGSEDVEGDVDGDIEMPEVEEYEEIDEEDLAELMKETYADLKGKSKLLPVKAFMEWENTREMIEEGILTPKAVSDMIKETQNGKGGDLSYEQFEKVLDLMDDYADLVMAESEGDEEYADEDEGENDDAKGDAMAAPSRKDESAALPTAKKISTSLGDENEDDDEDSDELTEDELEQLTQEAFDDLRGKAKLVSANALKHWATITEMVEDGFMSANDVDQILNDIRGAKKGDLNYEQFKELLDRLDDIVDDAYADEEEEDDEASDAAESSEATAKMSAEDVSKSLNDDELVEDDISDEELEVLTREAFDEARGKAKLVSPAALKKWTNVKSIMEEEILTEAEIDQLIMDVRGSMGDLTYEEFTELLDALDEATDNALMGDDGDEDYMDLEIDESEQEALLEALREGGVDIDGASASDGFTDSEGDEEDDIEDMDLEALEEEIEEMTRETFDALRNDAKTVPIKTFMNWDTVQEMVEDGIMTKDDVKKVVSSVKGDGKGGLNYNEFKSIIAELDEVADEFMEKHLEEGDNLDSSDGSELSESTDLAEDDGDDYAELSEEQIEEMTRETFDALRNDAKTVAIKTFMNWDTVQEMVEDGIMTKDDVKKVVSSVKGDGKGGLNYNEFKSIIAELDEVADEFMNGMDLEDAFASPVEGAAASATGEAVLDDFGQPTTSEDFVSQDGNEADDASDGGYMDISPEEEMEILREVFDELKNAKSGLLAVKKFLAWEGIQDAVADGDYSLKELKEAIKLTGADREMTFEQFFEMMKYCEEKMAERFDDDDDYADSLSETDMSEDDVEEASLLSSTSDGKAWMNAQNDDILPSNAGQGFGKAPAGKPMSKEKAQRKSEYDEMVAVSKEMFDELRGRKRSLEVEKFKNWKDVRQMIDSGLLKRSSLERAIAKVGALDSGHIQFDQFLKLMDIIQKEIDTKDLFSAMEDDEDEDDDDDGDDPTNDLAAAEVLEQLIASQKVLKTGSKTAKQPEVLERDLVDDELYGDEGDDIEIEEVDEMEAARSIYDELTPAGASVLPLKNFIQWDDVQELIESGALASESLAEAIEKTGATAEKGELTFEQFFDLLEIIDMYVDKDKLPSDSEDIVFEKKISADDAEGFAEVMGVVNDLRGKRADASDDDEDEDLMVDADDDEYFDSLGEDDYEDDEDEIEDADEIDEVRGSDRAKGDVKISYLKGDDRFEGDDALDEMETDMEEDDLSELNLDLANMDEEDRDEEVVEMFTDISRGKEFITVNQLRKWDELADLVDSGLVTKKSVDTYISRLDLIDGNKIDLSVFTEFMTMLDRVLVDEEGNFLDIEDEDKAI